MTPVQQALDAQRLEAAIRRAANMPSTTSPSGSPGQRFVNSAAYKRARASGAFEPMGHLPDDLQSVTVATEADLRSALRLRAYADLSFDIESMFPRMGELPGVARVPSLVESIGVEHVSIELAQELSESLQASAADDGTALPEGALTFTTTPAQTKLPRFGLAQPVSLSMMDEPGIVQAILDGCGSSAGSYAATGMMSVV